MVSTKETIMATLDRPDDNSKSNDPMQRVGATLSLEQQFSLRSYKEQLDNLAFTAENFDSLKQLLYQAFQLRLAQQQVTKQLLKRDLDGWGTPAA